MDELRIVDVTGAVTGRYEVLEEREDGTVVLSPDTSIDAIMRRLGSTPVSDGEFRAAFGDLHTGPASPVSDVSMSAANAATSAQG